MGATSKTEQSQFISKANHSPPVGSPFPAENSWAENTRGDGPNVSRMALPAVNASWEKALGINILISNSSPWEEINSEPESPIISQTAHPSSTRNQVSRQCQNFQASLEINTSSRLLLNFSQVTILFHAASHPFTFSFQVLLLLFSLS